MMERSDAGVYIYGRETASYTLLSCVGRGQLTEAYRAVSADGSPIMVTFFHQQENLDAKAFATRFYAQANQLITLRHPHILRILDFGEYRGTCFLVTQDSQGETLASHLRQQKRYGFLETTSLLEQVSTGLDAAHSQGFFHGGLSPKSILVERSTYAQITGFGLHALLQGTDQRPSGDPSSPILSIVGTYLGNPAYIAPECVYGKSVSSQSDLYALAILLFELLAGCLPFAGDHFLAICLAPLARTLPSLRTFRPDAPATLDQFFQQATNWRPEKRFANASDLMRAYQSAIEDSDSSRSVFMNIASVSPSPMACEEKSFDTLTTQEEITSTHHVSLSELSQAPWIQEGSEEPMGARKLLRRRPDIGAETYYVATPPNFELQDWLPNPVVGEIDSEGQNKRIRFTLSVDATVGVLRSLFGGLPPSGLQKHKLTHCFPIRSGDFPAAPGAFAPRVETFSSSRSTMVVESEPSVRTYPPRRYHLSVSRP